MPKGNFYSDDDFKIIRDCRAADPPMPWSKISAVFFPERSSHTLSSTWCKSKRRRATLFPNINVATGDHGNSYNSAAGYESHGGDEKASLDHEDTINNEARSQSPASVLSERSPTANSDTSYDDMFESNSSHKPTSHQSLDDLAREAEAIIQQQAVDATKRISDRPASPSRAVRDYSENPAHAASSSKRCKLSQDSSNTILPLHSSRQPSTFTEPRIPKEPSRYFTPINTNTSRLQRISRAASMGIPVPNSPIEKELDSAADRLLQEWTSPRRESRESAASQSQVTVLSQQAKDLYDSPQTQVPQNRAATPANPNAGTSQSVNQSVRPVAQNGATAGAPSTPTSAPARRRGTGGNKRKREPESDE